MNLQPIPVKQSLEYKIKSCLKCNGKLTLQYFNFSPFAFRMSKSKKSGYIPRKNRVKYSSQLTLPINLKVWSSSHGCERHHLPSKLRKRLRNQSRFTLPLFNAQGGRRITPRIVGDICSDMSRGYGKPQCHVLILGSNNLRRGEEPSEVCNLFNQILQHGSNIPKCHVVVCGILPSPEETTQSKVVFEDTSSLLKSLVKGYRKKSSFFNTAKLFQKHGRVRKRFFKRRNGQVDIHLRRRGARLMSKILKKHLMSHFPNILTN